MRISNISTATNTRPQVRRMTQREIQDTSINLSHDSIPIVPSSRWNNRRTSQIAPEINNSFPLYERPPPRNLDDDQKPPHPFHKGWLWFFGAVFCLILIIAVVAIVLGIVLPMITTTTTTAAPTDQGSGKRIEYDSRDSLGIRTDHELIRPSTESFLTGWQLYSYEYLATKTTPTVQFTFETDTDHVYYLDFVSVTNKNKPSLELLTNPSFENSSTNATGWIRTCELSCANEILSGSECYRSFGHCFKTSCATGRSSISFLTQSFMATIGSTYRISYMLKQSAKSTKGIMSFSFDVI